MEVLDRNESMKLLATQRFGRAVFNLDGLPVALPVNFVLVDGDVFFASSAGSKLDKAVKRAVMSLETDWVDPTCQTGWSVLVTGRAKHVTDSTTRQHVLAQLSDWAPGSQRHIVRVPSTYVSGRRLSRKT